MGMGREVGRGEVRMRLVLSERVDVLEILGAPWVARDSHCKGYPW